jgi:hypothetical protein
MSSCTSSRSPLRIWLVEIFAFGNLAFLAVDIYLAHRVNDFAHPAEWIPIYFSATVPLLLIPGIFKRRHNDGLSRKAGFIVGVSSILVGLAGLLLHLDGSFFHAQTLKTLVYTAPFAAPLSYAGVGLLLLLNRMEPDGSPAWGPWVTFLAMCGFVGNLALSLCDHAQNGFFAKTEWISVIASAFAVSFLLVAVVRQLDRRLHCACVFVMGLQILVGVLVGFALHATADLHGPADSIRDNFIYGAPVFAPLLFANLAILALIGLWEMLASGKSESIV